MNTLEIRKCLRKIHRSLEFNVFAANRIPINFTTPIYMICNLDPDTKPGSHWIGIFIGENGIGEYFDTFGRKPSGFHLDFLRRNSKKWIYNDRVIQNYFSPLCGEYCLIYLYCKFKGLSLSDFVQIFDDNTFHNDIMLKEMFDYFYLN